jgi:hypothetical protein
MKNLVFATTKFNLASSRSHSMFFIIVDAYSSENDLRLHSAKLTMVDLAGSERISIGPAKVGDQLLEKESININKS